MLLLPSSAEFYVKALLISRGVEARGHSIYDLLEELKRTGLHVPENLSMVARSLDRHYLQSRYVNTFHAGAPWIIIVRRMPRKRLKRLEKLLNTAKEKFKLVNEYLTYLRSKYTLRLVIVFGSLIKGDWTQYSDVDVVVVADELGGIT